MKSLTVIFALVLSTTLPTQANDEPKPTREGEIAAPAPRPIYSPYSMIRYEAPAAAATSKSMRELLPAAPARIANRPPIRPNKPRPAYLP